MGVTPETRVCQLPESFVTTAFGCTEATFDGTDMSDFGGRGVPPFLAQE
jgi:hypothetical protein